MLLSCAAKRPAHTNKPKALYCTDNLGDVLDYVQWQGYLDVPGVAACALARCRRNAKGCANVLDIDNSSLNENLWNAAFGGIVNCVVAKLNQHAEPTADHCSSDAYPEFSRRLLLESAVQDFVTCVLDAGAMISGGTVAQVACTGHSIKKTKK